METEMIVGTRVQLAEFNLLGTVVENPDPPGVLVEWDDGVETIYGGSDDPDESVEKNLKLLN